MNKTRITVRSVLTRLPGALVVPLTIALSAMQPVNAQEYPTRSVRMVVPIAPGSGGDTSMRFVAERLSKLFGQPVVVDNKPGAETLIATQSVLGAPADGYSLLMSSAAMLTVPLTNSAAGYDPLRDLRPIAIISRGPAMLVTGPQSRFTSIGQLLDEARRQSGSVSLAIYGNSHRVAAQVLARQGGPSFNLITYKGAGAASTDIIGGAVDVGLIDAGAALPLIKSGKLRGLAVTSVQRSAELPSVPTMRESGFPNFDFYAWIGVSVRSQTPEPVVRKLEQAIGKIVASQEFRDFLASRAPGAEPVGFVGPQAIKETEREAARVREVLAKPAGGQS